jgi:hypothetical protein
MDRLVAGALHIPLQLCKACSPENITKAIENIFLTLPFQQEAEIKSVVV